MSGPTERSDPREAIEAWILATLPRALAFASSLLHDRGLAEDVVHDCYARLLQKAETYDLAGVGTKILFKSITNACVDRNYRDRNLLSLEVESCGMPSPADAMATNPLEVVAYRELEEALAVALGRLTIAQRAAFELKSLGYSLNEIAEAVGTSPINAGVLVYRARKSLAEQLSRFQEKSADE